MKKPHPLHNSISPGLAAILRAVVALTVPTIACFGYYSLGTNNPADSSWATLVILAYPLIIVSGLGLVSVFTSDSNRRLKLIFSSAGLLVGILVLVIARG